MTTEQGAGDLEVAVRDEIADAERADRPIMQWVQKVRAWVSRHPQVELAYRVALAVFGGLVVVVGLILVPLPGPGWLTVFIGLTILGTEFHWARRITRWLKAMLDRFWTWWRARRARKTAARTAAAR